MPTKQSKSNRTDKLSKSLQDPTNSHLFKDREAILEMKLRVAVEEQMTRTQRKMILITEHFKKFNQIYNEE